LELLRKQLQGRIEDFETRLRDFAQINFSSPKQVLTVLKGLGFTVESTKKEVLAEINHSFTELLIEHRETSKLLSSFANRLPKHTRLDGRIHPEFHQLGAKTGRFTCSNPNLQQIPKEQEWRDLFVAPPGFKLITADYGQIELRILAEFSRDPKLIEAFKAGKDFHQEVVNLMGVSRKIAKAINFGIMYGMGPGRLAKHLGVKFSEAQKFLEDYYKAFPKVKRCLEQLEVRPIIDGYTVTPLGRKRYFNVPQTMKEHGELKRQGRNTPIQATCGDILKKAVLSISENLKGRRAGIVNLVHDEIVVEAEDGIAGDLAKVVETCMVRAGEEFIKAVPVTVDVTIDQRWKK
jgi:DNA polymerase-1